MKLIKYFLIFYIFSFNECSSFSKENVLKNEKDINAVKENIEINTNNKFIENYKYLNIIPSGNNFVLIRDNSGKKMTIEINIKKSEGEIK